MTANPSSVLDLTKKALGMDPEFTAFDSDVVMFTNAAFGSLRQVGIGPSTGFMITDNTTLWSQYVSSLTLLGMVQSYIFMSVKLAFDPPQTSFGISAVKDQIAELIWRIQIAAEEENPPSDPFGDTDVAHLYFAPRVVTLAAAPTVNIDASQGNMFYLTLTQDTTINAPVNGADGEHITLELTSNGHSVTWGNGWNFGDAGTPSLSSDKSDIVSAYYRGSVTEWRTGFTAGF
jgi:hypothetical protein